jgi:hypothetical protein
VGRTASMAADISADAGARTELSTSLQSVTLFANLTVLHSPTLAIVYSPLYIYLVAIRHRLSVPTVLFSIAAPLFAV